MMKQMKPYFLLLTSFLSSPVCGFQYYPFLSASPVMLPPESTGLCLASLQLLKNISDDWIESDFPTVAVLSNSLTL